MTHGLKSHGSAHGRFSARLVKFHFKLHIIMKKQTFITILKVISYIVTALLGALGHSAL